MYVKHTRRTISIPVYDTKQLTLNISKTFCEEMYAPSAVTSLHLISCATSPPSVLVIYAYAISVSILPLHIFSDTNVSTPSPPVPLLQSRLF